MFVKLNSLIYFKSRQNKMKLNKLCRSFYLVLQFRIFCNSRKKLFNDLSLTRTHIPGICCCCLQNKWKQESNLWNFFTTFSMKKLPSTMNIITIKVSQFLSSEIIRIRFNFPPHRTLLVGLTLQIDLDIRASFQL